MHRRSIRPAAPTRRSIATLLALLALVASVVVAAPANAQTDRVVGGSNTNISEAPWQIALLFDGYFGCGGSILDESTVITAGHCVVRESPSILTVRAGVSNRLSFNGQDRGVSEIIFHPLYSEGSFYDNFDVAILKLSQPLTFNSQVQPIKVAKRTQPGLIAPGKAAVTSGWGLLSFTGSTLPVTLQSVTMPIVSDAACNQQLTTLTPFSVQIVNGTMVCAGGLASGVDSCSGDSGGPLVTRDGAGNPYLVGVVSWGYRCGVPGLAGVYAQAPNFEAWIARQMEPPAPPAPTSSSKLFSNIGFAQIQDKKTTIKNISARGLPGTVTDVNVIITGLTHTSPRDLRVSVKSPSGQVVQVMVSDGGTRNASSVRLTFNDEASGPIQPGVRLSTGAYQPENPLSAFDGTTANGRWSVRVTDASNGDEGSITGVRLLIASST